MGVSLETLKICTIMNKNRLNIIASISLTLLLIPLIAMQFTDEVNWTISIAILAMLLLVWLELAVGIFGTPFAGD